VGALLVEARVRSRHLDPQDFEDIRNLVLPQSRDKELLLDWRSSLARSLPLQANQVRQVLINLLLNAIKAMPDGGELGVALGQANGEAWVSISDTGQGIAPGDLENIFDPFYTTAPVGQGTGLGLSICYSIIKQHFGTITVESEAGRGSAFTVSLPIL